MTNVYYSRRQGLGLCVGDLLLPFVNLFSRPWSATRRKSSGQCWSVWRCPRWTMPSRSSTPTPTATARPSSPPTAPQPASTRWSATWGRWGSTCPSPSLCPCSPSLAHEDLSGETPTSTANRWVVGGSQSVGGELSPASQPWIGPPCGTVLTGGIEGSVLSSKPCLFLHKLSVWSEMLVLIKTEHEDGKKSRRRTKRLFWCSYRHREGSVMTPLQFRVWPHLSRTLCEGSKIWFVCSFCALTCDSGWPLLTLWDSFSSQLVKVATLCERASRSTCRSRQWGHCVGQNRDLSVDRLVKLQTSPCQQCVQFDTQIMISCFGPHIWNSLPQALRHC